MNSLKAHFLLDPNVIFLNHGSFGATPRPVFEAYQRYQRQLEWQPVDYIVHQLPDLLREARHTLGDFLGVCGDDLVYVPNATFALNIIARSLNLQPGDQLLTTDHEYGACTNAWQFMAQKRGFDIVKQAIPLPATAPDAIADQLWAGVTPRTRAIFISHIASPTALCFPAADICRRARAAGILTIVDGAHAPGQIPLDLQAIDADFYFGNAHKWLGSPRGAAFLYARPDTQPLLEPLVVGWGWGAERTVTFGSDFLDHHQWLGTNDLSAYLSVPDAIQFQSDHDWDTVRAHCHALLEQTVQRICALTGLTPLYPAGAGFYHQMAAIPLPTLTDTAVLKRQLLEDFRIEVPIVEWHGRGFIRVSVQGYNTRADIDALLHALRQLIG